MVGNGFIFAKVHLFSRIATCCSPRVLTGRNNCWGKSHKLRQITQATGQHAKGGGKTSRSVGLELLQAFVGRERRAEPRLFFKVEVAFAYTAPVEILRFRL